MYYNIYFDRESECEKIIVFGCKFMPIVNVCTCFPVFVPMYFRQLKWKYEYQCSRLHTQSVSNIKYEAKNYSYFRSYVVDCSVPLSIAHFILWIVEIRYDCFEIYSMKSAHAEKALKYHLVTVKQCYCFPQDMIFNLFCFAFVKILIFGWRSHSAKLFHFLYLFDRIQLLQCASCTVSQSASHWSLVFLHSRPESSASD